MASQTVQTETTAIGNCITLPFCDIQTLDTTVVVLACWRISNKNVDSVNPPSFSNEINLLLLIILRGN